MAVAIVIGFDSLAIVVAIGVLVTAALLIPAAGLPTSQTRAAGRSGMRLFGLCLLLLWLTSLAWLWTRSATMSGQSAWTVLPVVPTVLFGSHFGTAWWLRAAAVVATTAVFLLRVRRRRDPDFAGMVLLLFGLGWIIASRSASGHAAANGDWTVREALDWLHFAAISVWGGSLMATLLLLFPRLRHVTGACPGRFAARFSLLATAALAIVLLTGVYNAWHMLPAVSALWNSHYGRLLAIKLMAVGGMVVCGGLNHYHFVPRLRTDAVQGHAGTMHRFQGCVLIEALLLLLVLAVTAVLLGAMPPMANG